VAFERSVFDCLISLDVKGVGQGFRLRKQT
jgi:hypothetical protein